MQVLVVVPARGGSKGVPNKNCRLLAGKPLLYYTLEVAKQLAPANQICVSTDSPAIAALTQEFGLEVPFLRPPELATDSAGMYPVLLHAINRFSENKSLPDAVVLLQPTSPFRLLNQVKEAIELFSPELDMVVSVTQTKANPYFTLFEEVNGFLQKSKTVSGLERRQDAPKVYQLNGAIYVINVQSLVKNNSFAAFERVLKYEMDELNSVDIDTELDWQFCEFILEKNLWQGNSQF